MNLEHHRKAGKRLLRALRAEDPVALRRASEALGDQRQGPFHLSDALHVIAREQGYRTWPELKRAAESSPDPERTDIRLDTGLEYRPQEPVRVRVVRRGSRIWVSDEGVAYELAGRPPAWHKAAEQVEHELGVNFSRSGAISLPVVAVGPSEEEVVRRIGEASRAFYQELLELG